MGWWNRSLQFFERTTLAWLANLSHASDAKASADFNNCMPVVLPFPKARLHNTVFQMINGRSQLMDFHGSFVLTEIDKLPAGGKVCNFPLQTPTATFVLFGDMGAPSEQRSQVIQAMNKSLHDSKCNKSTPFVIGLGDWMYPRGPTDHSKSQINLAHKTIFHACQPLIKSAPLYGILGNHEYGDEIAPANPEAFLQAASQAGIVIPSRYYQLEFDHKEFGIDCFALDTSTIATDVDQVQWLTQQLAYSVARETREAMPRWRIIAAHHPLESYGLHEGETLFLKSLLSTALPQIHLYICGHEHDMEFLDFSDKLNQKPSEKLPPMLLTGTTSYSRSVQQGSFSQYATSVAGFGHLNISKDRLLIDCFEINTNKLAPKKQGFHKTVYFDTLN